MRNPVGYQMFAKDVMRKIHQLQDHPEMSLPGFGNYQKGKYLINHYV
jgi:hypothetical protein